MKELKELSKNFEVFPFVSGWDKLIFLFHFSAVMNDALNSFKLALDEIGAWDIDLNGYTVLVRAITAKRA